MVVFLIGMMITVMRVRMVVHVVLSFGYGVWVLSSGSVRWVLMEFVIC